MPHTDSNIIEPRAAHLNEQEVEVITGIKNAVTRTLAGHSFRLILFGSKARGDDDSESDIDLAILVEGLYRSLKRAIFDAIADVEIEHLTPVSAP